MMDVMDFQEKMDPAHRAYFCRMLKMKDLPEHLLEQYVQVKRMVDRVDASLSIGILALIAIIANFGETTEEEDARLQAQADELAVKPVEPLDEVVEQPVEQPVSGATGQAAPEQSEQSLDKPQSAASGKLWSPGMPVNVLHNESLMSGKIVGIKEPESGSQDMVQLTVELDTGDIVNVNEDEVEAD